MNQMYIAKLMMHRWEEEPISGIERGYNGTFAIFFYGCNMHCLFCQNSNISRVKVPELQVDKIITCEELAYKMIEAEKKGAASVSFITGLWYKNEIIKTIKLAKNIGLKIPIVYNSNGYEMDYHIKKFIGLIDIYLPDFKYYDDELGKRYSKISDYSVIAKSCIREMYNQVKGKLIVRHLVLPGHTEDSKKILKYLYEEYGNNICYSIMSQYTPVDSECIKMYKELNRKLTKREYEKVVSYAIDIGIRNAYIQEGDVAKESFIPDFSC